MRVKLNNVRIAFCSSLFEPEQYKGQGAFRHSSTFLIAPGSENDKVVREAIKLSADSSWDKKAASTLKSIEGNNGKFCYTPGDLKEWEGAQGMMVLTANRKSTDGAPTLLDRDKTKLTTNTGRLYGGCYVNASVEIYAQTGEYTGMRCGLLGVQFHTDGDSFGGASKAKEDDFDDVSVLVDDLA